MSHWKDGKISLSCSLGVLERALKNIRKTWRIEVDETGGLLANSNYQAVRSGFQLVIRMGEGGVHGADIGFKKNADGTWQVHHDYLPEGVRDFDGVVKQQVATMRARAIAQTQKFQIVTDIQRGNENIIEMLVPIEDFERA